MDSEFWAAAQARKLARIAAQHGIGYIDDDGRRHIGITSSGAQAKRYEDVVGWGFHPDDVPNHKNGWQAEGAEGADDEPVDDYHEQRVAALTGPGRVGER